MKEKHVLRFEALMGWCKNTLGPASVPHEVMAAVVGGIVRYAAPYLSDTAEAVVNLNAPIKAAALQFEKLPKDLSNVAVRSGHGLRLADAQVNCRDSVVANLAQLTHHRSVTVCEEGAGGPHDTPAVGQPTAQAQDRGAAHAGGHLRDHSGTVLQRPCGAPRERRCPYP